MTIVHNNMIPGILTTSVEFFAVAEYRIQALHNGGLHNFRELPASVHGIVRDIMRNPNASVEEMEVFVYNRWGGLDNVPDIDENGKTSGPEYLKGVTPAYFDNGVKISDAQLRVLEMINIHNSIIVEQLFISKHTVARHIQDMLSASCMTRKGLISWAKGKGII